MTDRLLYHHRDHGRRRYTVRYDPPRVRMTDIETGEVITADGSPSGPVYFCSDFCRCQEVTP